MRSVTEKKKKKKSQPELGDKLAGRRYNSQMNFHFRGDILDVRSPNVKMEIHGLFEIIIYRFRQDLLIFKEIFFFDATQKDLYN